LTLDDGTDSPETSVSNHLTPHNNPEDGRIKFWRFNYDCCAFVGVYLIILVHGDESYSESSVFVHVFKLEHYIRNM
jgi:hypothetical protein